MRCHGIDMKYRNTLVSCYLGYITQAIIVNLTPLFFVIFREEYNMSLAGIGQIVLVLFLMQLFIDAFAIKFVDKIGYKKTAVISSCFAALGLVLMSVLPVLMDNTYAAVMISIIVGSVGAGLTEVIISPIVDSLPSEAKASTMSLLHAFYCWGQLLVVVVTTIVLKIIVNMLGPEFWMLIPAAWALIPFFNIFGFIKAPVIEPHDTNSFSGLLSLFKDKTFIVVLVLMICAGASECSMSQWASYFAEVALGIPKVVGDILGPGLFALFMGIGRTVYGCFGKKIDLKKCLAACSVITVICYVLTIFCRLSAVSLIGCSVCGLGVSLMWPGMLSMSSERFPSGGSAMFALLALGGDIGCSIGPWITGIVSDKVCEGTYFLKISESIGMEIQELALRSGLFVVMIFPIFSVIGVIAIIRGLKKKN